ncbi:Asx homology domain-containing protein [Hysterangium stoloniferum]|nr:Asx homology domain-containing protein [Hysterangium stoloniferum]
MTSETPRRSTRNTHKEEDEKISKGPLEGVQGSSSNSVKKRKEPPPKEDVKTDEYLLTSKKSPIVDIELSTLINRNTWDALSPDSRALLSTMLPPPFFPFFKPRLIPNHPSSRQLQESLGEVDEALNDVDAMTLASEPDVSFFTDPFFEAALSTFQDQLSAGQFSATHETLVREYTEKVKQGTIHAAWKDQTWQDTHPIILRRPIDADVLAGDASSITLGDLAKNSIIRTGDILAYRRNFSHLNCTVAKDVDSLQPSKYSLTVLTTPSSQTYLPLADIQHLSITTTSSGAEPDILLRLAAISTPAQLENALLDTDGRIKKDKRPSASAWKSIGLWRWRDGQAPDPTAYAEDSPEAIRGYREYQGTLFYLRGCFYDDMYSS